MGSHAILDENSRVLKAKKIQVLVHKYGNFGMRKMLEVGCGSGFLAHYFSHMGYGEKGTHSLDVVDERQIKKGYQFQCIQGTKLPFPDADFDFMISNHVVEHVGSREEQSRHIGEMFRCLEAGGVLYFAVPNRWRLFESHYKLPLLSWFSEKGSSAYVRFFRRGSYYDCNPLSRRETIKLLSSAGFEFKDATLDSIAILGEIEGNFLIKWIAKLPKVFWMPFLVIMPTLIFVCRKPML
ncbi:MAG: hypothetical protein DRR42_27375 [Gammaproteobacteria bacterium]|nr:MAG: hypothetical protein DRR42_27375 [Gammaproteobacteria bacterium]